MNPELGNTFDTYFELVHANTDELRRQAYELRYQVYVLETGFEDEKNCRCMEVPGRGRVCWEEDAFDLRADHCLIRHRRSGIYAATARLILPQPDAWTVPFPIELHCPLQSPVTDIETRIHLGEISRFVVSRVFKRRIGELGTLAGVSENTDIYFDADERRLLPHLSLGLFAGIVYMAHNNHVTHCYAVMEPALLRLLGRFGVLFNRIGADVDYHGIRVPCLGILQEALPNIRRVAPSVWDFITNRGEWV